MMAKCLLTINLFYAVPLALKAVDCCRLSMYNTYTAELNPVDDSFKLCMDTGTREI